MPWVGLQCVYVLFPDHTHLLLEAMTMKIFDFIALFGMYCICQTTVHRSYRYMTCNRIYTIDFCCKKHQQNAFQTDDTEIRYDCAKFYHVLYMKCAKGILFGL